MYKPGEMYSAVKNYVADHKAGIANTMAAGLVAVVAAGLVAVVAAGDTPKPDFYPQKEWANTLVYKEPKTSQEVVAYDLKGVWRADRGYHSETRFRIEQEGNKVKITTIDGTQYKSPGSEIIRATLDGNLILGQYDVYPDGWSRLEGKINKGGTYIKTETYWSRGIGKLNIERISK
ncbi:hypothetical protein HYU50_03240 [Candidatus Woesearchaeota archaeon]|nr:hypothetical protein [Candidatus Woesearchaeota archaeon]